MKAQRANHVSQYVVHFSLFLVKTYQSSVKTDALSILTHQIVCGTLGVLAHFNHFERKHSMPPERGGVRGPTGRSSDIILSMWVSQNKLSTSPISTNTVFSWE